jgi:excisionase family DNA binding protein
MTARELDQAALLTIGQIAKILKRSRPTVVRVLRAGGVAVLRVGNRYSVERLTLAEKMPGVYAAIESVVVNDELERRGLAD